MGSDFEPAKALGGCRYPNRASFRVRLEAYHSPLGSRPRPVRRDPGGVLGGENTNGWVVAWRPMCACASVEWLTLSGAGAGLECLTVPVGDIVP
jgi:hypothetical protein